MAALKKATPPAATPYDLPVKPAGPTTSMETTERCGTCNGTGRIFKPIAAKLAAPGDGGFVPGDAPCPDCGGRGTVDMNLP